ncbi:hypothetical protein Hypma_006201 [Hypsizygus marmoreus]|uniref:Uncharacterized protein n=1 Tax=Hypsizygus marmoreus TaxID=39966 RepID=A0A369K2M6_HYPMA|nr:hypothetical protein Hypma_006201 [Hypsizygus marmoreus]
MKPHPPTTRLSRFKGDVSVSATSDSPIANMIYEARCEITSQSCSVPLHLNMSSDGAILALPGMGGYKDRCPVLRYYLLDEETDDGLNPRRINVGLTDIAFHSGIDASRKLVFVADRKRIKSYTWGIPMDDGHLRTLPTHTTDSSS